MAKVKLINRKFYHPNIKKILSRAKFTSNIAILQDHDVRTLQITKCNNKTIGTYSLIFECSEIKLKNSNKPFMMKSRMDCTATNIVYMMKCTGCGKEYVGGTLNIRVSVRVHKQPALDPCLCHLYVNHNIPHCAMGRPTLFQIIPFYAMNRDDKPFCEEIEQHFIKKFCPKLD